VETREQHQQLGVYYEREDYASVWRRLLIDAVDIPLALAISIVLLAAVASEFDDTPGLLFALLAITWFGYFVVLKGSRYRTLGYIVAKARIVNLAGERPGVFSLILRLLFVVGGPLNSLIDLLWLTGDPHRQALRDKFASTYVIRQAAVPVGTGMVRVRTYMFWGMTFLFREVTRAKGAACTSA
jgi:uncharacterized RDD family membrane protein YckC